MLSRIEIEGYRSLKHIKMEDMGGLTVLIGPNGSGKTNLLDAFALMSEAAFGSLAEGINKRGGIETLLCRGCERKLFFGFDFESVGQFAEEKAEVHYQVQIRPVGFSPTIPFEQVSKAPVPPHRDPLYLMHRDREGTCIFFNKLLGQKDEVKGLESPAELAIFQVKDQTSYPTPYKVLRHLQEWVFYRPIDVGPSSPIRQAQIVRPGTRLTADMSNLASVFHSIQNQYPAVWDEINEILKNVYEDFRYISFPPEGGDGKIILRWWEHPFEKEYGFSADLLSDGTLRLLALLAMLKSPNPPPLICLDEPELGLHPDWVKLVAELLESAATRTQLIVATHSPTLVSHVAPEHVAVVEKEDGATVVHQLTEAELADWLDRFSLGELWEAGHIGGRP